MRRILVYILFVSSGASCNNDKHQTVEKKESKSVLLALHRIPDSVFTYHLKVLDSVANAHPRDTLYKCCFSSVNFIEAKTGIEANVDGDYFGAIGFTKKDLRNWQDWYDKKYKK